MSYKSVTIFLLMFVSFINVTGCDKGQEDLQITTLQQKISSLNQRIIQLQEKDNQRIEKISALSEQVGIGKKQYLEENNMSNSKIILWSGIFSMLTIIIILFFTYRKFSIAKEMHEKEKIDMSETNRASQKLILDLEHEIKQLKLALDDGEKNEVSNLLKTLKSERELRKHKIGGFNEQ